MKVNRCTFRLSHIFSGIIRSIFSCIPDTCLANSQCISSDNTNLYQFFCSLNGPELKTYIIVLTFMTL